MKRCKLHRFLTLVIVIALFSALVIACNSKNGDEDISQKPSTSYPFEYKDKLERTVEIKGEPEKIVSLSSSTTEILFALGMGDKLVGVTSFCNYPEEADSIEKVGDYSQINIEKIVSLESDLVLASAGIQEDTVEKLEELDITVVSIEGTDFEGIYKSVLDIGRITGAENEAKELVDDIKKKIEDIQNKVKDSEQRDCYFVLGYGEAGDWTVGSGSFIDEMIEMAGGKNIAGDEDSPWISYSIEKLIEKDPEILIISSAAGDIDRINTAEGYRELRAVKEGNLKVIDADIVSRPGPRVVEALEEIAKALHPEQFR